MKSKTNSLHLSIVYCLMGVNLLTACRPDKNISLPSAPTWHPFKVDKNLTLDQLVKDGYRLQSMIGGMPQFYKQIGDTTILYDLSNLDCYFKYNNEGELIYNPLPENNPTYAIEEEEITPKENVSSKIHIEANSPTSDTLVNTYQHSAEQWRLQSTANPYFPWDKDSIRDCFQGISYSQYSITLKDIDSSEIVQFIERFDGIIQDSSNWNTQQGEIIYVLYPPVGKVYPVRVEKELYLNQYRLTVIRIDQSQTFEQIYTPTEE